MLHIFLNSSANRCGAAASWKRVEDELNRRGRRFVLYQLKAPSELDSLVKKVWQEGGRQFAAAGGDGTLQLVTEALMRNLTSEQRSEIALGAIGLGTSNDFHKSSVKEPGPSAKTCVEGGRSSKSPLVGGVPCRIDDENQFEVDVIELIVKPQHGETQTHWCLQAIHIGTIPAANHCLTQGGGWCEWLYHRWYSAALHSAALYAVFLYPGFEGVIETSGNSFSGTFNGMTLLKRCNIAGQFVIATRRKPDDGLLDLGLCRKTSSLRLLQLNMAFADQGFSGHPEVEFREVSEMKASFSAPQWIDFDGELVQADGIEVRVVPKALRMMA